jgi:WD40 repeat protein
MSLAVVLYRGAGPILLKSSDGTGTIASCEVDNDVTALCVSPDASKVYYSQKRSIFTWHVVDDSIDRVATMDSDPESLRLNNTGDRLLVKTSQKLSLVSLADAKIAWAASVASTIQDCPSFTQNGDRVVGSAKGKAGQRHHYGYGYGYGYQRNRDQEPLDDDIIILESTTGAEMLRIQDDSGAVTAVASSPVSSLAAVAKRRTVLLWDVDSGKTGFDAATTEPLCSDTVVHTLQFSANGQQLLSCRWDDGSVIMWDTASKAQLRSFKIAIGGEITRFAWSPDERHIAFGKLSSGKCSSVCIVDTETNSVHCELRGVEAKAFAYSVPQVILL